jgi:hypothetical protein
MNEKPSFFAELKRRNVYKVAVAYAVMAVRDFGLTNRTIPPSGH